MTIFNEARSRVIDVNPNSASDCLEWRWSRLCWRLRCLLGRQGGFRHVGVLTLFGRVTGEALPEGVHLVNPFKANTSYRFAPRKSRNRRACRRLKAW